MNDSNRTLERIAQRVPVPEPAYERLLGRRHRRDRNRRVSAAVLVIALALLSIAGLARAFGGSTRPVSQPSPTPGGVGIFSGIGGWIVCGDGPGIWAYDPDHPRRPAVLVSAHFGTPIAWSPDGSKLLLLEGSVTHSVLSVLDSDGSETTLADWKRDISGGSFSPDGSRVVFASEDWSSGESAIYLVGSSGGRPKVLFRPHAILGIPGVPAPVYEPTFSPDGSHIAYFDGWGDHDNTLRVMSADGTGSRVLLEGNSPAMGVGLRNLAWFPDGTRLVFGEGYGPYWIYTVWTDGSGITREIRGSHPNLSPDGARITYAVGDAYGAAPVMIANADGTSARELPAAPASGPWNPAPPR